jgi:hypothetical protein
MAIARVMSQDLMTAAPHPVPGTPTLSATAEAGTGKEVAIWLGGVALLAVAAALTANMFGTATYVGTTQRVARGLEATTDGFTLFALFYAAGKPSSASLSRCQESSNWRRQRQKLTRRKLRLLKLRSPYPRLLRMGPVRHKKRLGSSRQRRRNSLPRSGSRPRLSGYLPRLWVSGQPQLWICTCSRRSERRSSGRLSTFSLRAS